MAEEIDITKKKKKNVKTLLEEPNVGLDLETLDQEEEEEVVVPPVSQTFKPSGFAPGPVDTTQLDPSIESGEYAAKIQAKTGAGEDQVFGTDDDLEGVQKMIFEARLSHRRSSWNISERSSIL